MCSGRRVSLSFFQQFPFLREVFNPLEDRMVDGIVNHVDFGLELDQSLHGRDEGGDDSGGHSG